MAYRYIEFDGVLLPTANFEQQHDTAPIESDLQDSVGSVYDYRGAARKAARKQTISLRGIYWGETGYMVDEAGNPIVDEAGNYLIAGDAVNMLRAQVDALRAKRGARGPLWRVRISDGARQWLTARLLQIAWQRTRPDMAVRAELSCLFESAMTAWRAETGTGVTASAAAATPTGLLVQNGGDVAVADAVLSVARTSGTITAVRVQGPGIDWTWTGSIGAGQTLTLDCGAQIMRVGSANAYSGWVRGVGHTADGMLPLGVGDTILTVTLTGGGGDVTLTHYNQFG